MIATFKECNLTDNDIEKIRTLISDLVLEDIVFEYNDGNVIFRSDY